MLTEKNNYNSELDAVASDSDDDLMDNAPEMVEDDAVPVEFFQQ